MKLKNSHLCVGICIVIVIIIILILAIRPEGHWKCTNQQNAYKITCTHCQAEPQVSDGYVACADGSITAETNDSLSYLDVLKMAENLTMDFGDSFYGTKVSECTKDITVTNEQICKSDQIWVKNS